MTTDAEIQGYFSGYFEEMAKPGMPPTSDWRERIFEAFLETPERRTKLATSMMVPAQHSLDFAITKRRRWAEGMTGVTTWIKRFERLKDALTGEETFDRTRFFSLYGDLRATQDEIKAVRKAFKKTSPV